MSSVLLRSSIRRRGAMISAVALVALAAGYILTPSVAAQEPSVQASGVAAPAERPLQDGEPGLCQDDFGFVQAACVWCDLDACGCIYIEGCVLYFSCTCSPIQCTRSCENKFCVP
jgi:hypothetical protein